MSDTQEKLDKIVEVCFIRGSNAHDLHGYSKKWDEMLEFAKQHEAKKIQALIESAKREELEAVLTTRGTDGCDGYCDTNFVEERLAQLKQSEEKA